MDTTESIAYLRLSCLGVLCRCSRVSLSLPRRGNLKLTQMEEIGGRYLPTLFREISSCA